MHLTDFLGREYGPGDLVIYGAMSGRSVNIVVGRVVDIYRVYREREHYRWVRLEEGQEPPLVPYGKDEGDPEETSVRVKVQPLRGARWKQHHGRTRYIDTRSGKGINPDAPSGKHVLKESHFVHADGTDYDRETDRMQHQQRRMTTIQERVYGHLPADESFELWFRKNYHINYGKPGTFRYPLEGAAKDMKQLWWVSRTYQPWVKEVSNGPEPVTLEITDNIVKWEGELPDDLPDEVP